MGRSWRAGFIWIMPCGWRWAAFPCHAPAQRGAVFGMEAPNPITPHYNTVHYERIRFGRIRLPTVRVPSRDLPAYAVVEL